MASCRVRDPRVLVAIVCGLLTAIILGLGIWVTVVRIQTGTSTPTSNTEIKFCSNDGIWENGRCICPEKWKGIRCTIRNFCNGSTEGNFTFEEIVAGKYGPSTQKCEENTLNAGHPKATGLCSISEYGVLELGNVREGNCNENLETLEKKVNSGKPSYDDISNTAQWLTSETNTLTAQNITSAAMVVGQIFTSKEASLQAKQEAVTTVSQLLQAPTDVFENVAVNDSVLAMLIEEMEKYSTNTSIGDKPVVQPNVAIQSVNLSSGNTVLFSVKKGASDSLHHGSTAVDTKANQLNADTDTELQILLNTSNRNETCGFVVYQNNKFFKSKVFKTESNFSQKIISSSTNGTGQRTVDIVFNPTYDHKKMGIHSFACVYWNFTKKDWDTNGCTKKNMTNGFLYCHCNHTTNFGVLMSFKKNYKYPESLDKLSTAGCALSITGLFLTIVFQIVTRNVRKTSVTWVIVCLCTSMLIFNLLFVFGIENSNKKLNNNTDTNDMGSAKNEIPETPFISNPTCTVVAALLHYFLLVTFTWTGISAAQLYFLLIRTMKPLPQHFVLFISIIGWGVPAVVVVLTIGLIFSQNKSDLQWELNYRQEEICWLATSVNNNIVTSPFLWAFVLPVTLILTHNVVVFIIIIVKVIWKKNHNLTSTKKVSTLKKILSMLSIAVVFGITWILAYCMLINNEYIMIVFSYLFCIFNTTQGLQIFILYTVRTKIFQNEASKVLKSLSLSSGRMKSLSSVGSLRLRVRIYNLLRSFPTLNEHFRLLEPSVITEEFTLSESEEANPSI